MIRITKGDIILDCETEGDVKLALAVLTFDEAVVLPGVRVYPVVNGQAVAPPEWRVGGPPDVFTGLRGNHPLAGDAMTADLLAELEEDKPVLSLVTESHDSVAPQHISVRDRQLDILDAVIAFPEGVTCRGVAELLGLSDKTVSGRMQLLKRAGLVEKLQGHHSWRATTLARRAKLVRS